MSNISTIIERATRNDPSLTEIELSFRQISTTEAAGLASALAGNAFVKKLRLLLSDDLISRECVASIVSVLEENITLQEFAFYAYTIGDTEVSSLASMLRNNASLQTLILIGNDMGPDRAATLASTLRENKTLKSLGIRGNSIGDEGAAALASALQENKTLESLDLTMNRISDKGASSIASTSRENKTLQKIDLSFNDIGRDGAGLILSALEVNKTTTSFMLDGNHYIEESQRQGIEAFILRNRRLKNIHQTSDCMKEEYDLRSGQGLVDSIGGLNGNQDDFESVMFVLLLEMPEIMERTYYERIRKKRSA